MAISDCVALRALRDGAGLKGIPFISSQIVLTDYHGSANYRRLRDNSNTWLNALVVVTDVRTRPASQLAAQHDREGNAVLARRPGRDLHVAWSCLNSVSPSGGGVVECLQAEARTPCHRADRVTLRSK